VKGRKGYWIYILLIIAGILLILETFSAYGYSSDWNLGVLLPGMIGAALIVIALRPLLFHAFFGPISQAEGAMGSRTGAAGAGFKNSLLYRITKPLSRRLRTVLTVVLILCLLVFMIVEALIIMDPYLHRSELAGDVDYLIVLGAGIWPDGSPTLSLRYRLDEAIAYYNSHGPLRIIVSGGQGANEPYPEALAMSRYLQDRGIPLEDILVEDRSTSTMENFKFSRQLMGDWIREPIRIVFITNDFHVLRSRILASRNGFEAYAIAAPTPNVVLINSYLREFFAFVKSMLVDY